MLAVSERGMAMRVRKTAVEQLILLISAVAFACALLHAAVLPASETPASPSVGIGEPFLPGEWRAFGGAALGCDGAIDAMAATPDGSIVYLGGYFTSCGNVIADRVVAFYPATGEFRALGDGAANGVGGNGSVVYDLHVHQGSLYVTGMFERAGHLQDVGAIARWDGSTWSPLASGLGYGMSEPYGLALISHQGDLVVGGRFSHAGDEQVNHLARWNGEQWTAFEAGGVRGLSSQVNALASDQQRIYVGGTFNAAGGQPVGKLAAWNGSVWETMAGGVAYPPANVEALEIYGGHLYVGGRFTTAGGVSTTGIARWDGTAWAPVGETSDVREIKALHASGQGLITTGVFTLAGGVLANGLARWDGNEWHAMGTGLRRDGAGYGMAVLELGSDIYVGGGFSYVDNVPAINVAVLRNGHWGPATVVPSDGLHAEFRPSGPSWPVAWPVAMASYGGHLYVGGRITIAGDKVVNDIARWDGSKWSPLGSPGSVGVDGHVVAMLPWQDELWISGSFSRAGGKDSPWIARWSGTEWSPFKPGLTLQGSSQGFNAMATDGENLFVGGSFNGVDGVAAFGVARWDGQTWSAMGNGMGSDGYVNDLVFHDGQLYLAGHYEQAGTTQNRVYRWTGTEWQSLGGEFEIPGGSVLYPPMVNTLAVVDGSLYAGGRFHVADGMLAKGVARWDGASWSPVGQGVNGDVTDLEALGDGLLAVGSSDAHPEDTALVSYWGRTDGGMDKTWMRLGADGYVGELDDTQSGEARAVAVHGGQIYVAGDFSALRKNDGVEVSSLIARFALDPIFAHGFELQ